MAQARNIRIIADDDLKVLKDMTDAIRELNTVIATVTPSMLQHTQAFHQQFRGDLKATTTALHKFATAAERVGKTAVYTQAGAQAGQAFAGGLQQALASVPMMMNLGGGGNSVSAMQNQLRMMVSQVNAGLTTAERDAELASGRNLGDTFAKGIQAGLTNRQLGNLLKNAVDNLSEGANADASGQRLAEVFAKGVAMGLRKSDLKAYVDREFQQILKEGELNGLKGFEFSDQRNVRTMRDLFDPKKLFADMKNASADLARLGVLYMGEFGRGIGDGLPSVRAAFQQVGDAMRTLGNLDSWHDLGMLVMRTMGQGMGTGVRWLTMGLQQALGLAMRGAQALGNAVMGFGEWMARQIGNGLKAAAHLVGDGLRWVFDRLRGEPMADQVGVDTGRRFANGMIQGLFGESNALRRAGVQLIQDGFSTLAGSGVGLLVQGQAARTAIDFEAQLKLVEVFGDLTVAEVERVKSKIFSVAMETIFDPDEQAEAFLTLLKSGLTVDDAESILKPLSDFAVASQDTLAGASEKMIQAMSAFGIPLEEITTVMDALVAGADISITSVQDLAHGMTFVAPVANSMGIEVQEVATALALLSDRGLDATRGGTGLRAALRSLIKPTEKAKQILDQLNITTKDAEGNFVGMSALLKQFDVAVTGLRQRGLGEVEITELLAPLADTVGVTALLNLIGTTEDGTLAFDEYARKLGEARSAAEVAAAVSGTFKFKLDELGSAVQVLNIQAFTPFLNDVIAPFVVQLTEMVGVLAMVDEDVLKMGLTLFAGVSALAGLFAVLQIGVGTLAVLGAGMATFGAIATSPLLLIGGALAGLVLVFVDLDGLWKGFLRGLEIGTGVLLGVADRLGGVWTQLMGVRDVVREVTEAMAMSLTSRSKTVDVMGEVSNADAMQALQEERALLFRNIEHPIADYDVQVGDTLSGIAAEVGTTVEALMRLNALTDPRALSAGAMLRTREGLMGESAVARVAEIDELLRTMPATSLKVIGKTTENWDAVLFRVVGKHARLYDLLRYIGSALGYVNAVFKEIQASMASGQGWVEAMSDVLQNSRNFSFMGFQLGGAGALSVVDNIDFGMPLGDRLLEGLTALGQSDFEGGVKTFVDRLFEAFRLVMLVVAPWRTLGSAVLQAIVAGIQDDLGQIQAVIEQYDLVNRIGRSLEQTLPIGLVSTAKSYLDVLMAIGQGDFTGAVAELGVAVRQTFVQVGGLFGAGMPQDVDAADRKFYATALNPLGQMLDGLLVWVREQAPTKLAELAGALLAQMSVAIGAVFTYASAEQFFIPQLIEFVDSALDGMNAALTGEGATGVDNGFTTLFKGLVRNTTAWFAGDGAKLLGTLVGTAFAVLGDMLKAAGEVWFGETDWTGFAHSFMDSFGKGFADGALSWWDQNDVVLPVGMGFHMRLSGTGVELVQLEDLAQEAVGNLGSMMFGSGAAVVEDVPMNFTAALALDVNRIQVLYDEAGKDTPTAFDELMTTLGNLPEFDVVDGQLQFTQDAGVAFPISPIIAGMSPEQESVFRANLKKLGADVVSGVDLGITERHLQAGDWIVNELRESLDIHSPSGVGIEIGGYLAEGLQIGFKTKFMGWDVNDLIFGAYALGNEGVVEGVSAEEGMTTPFSAILVDVNAYVNEGVPSLLLAHETLRVDMGVTGEGFNALGVSAMAAVDGIIGRVTGLGARMQTLTGQVTGLGREFQTAGVMATNGTHAMLLAMDALYMKLKLIAPLADAITKMFSMAGQPISTGAGSVTGRYAGGMVTSGTLAEVAETRRGVGFEIFESGGRSYLYGNADVNVVSPYGAGMMDQYRSVGTESSVSYGGDTAVNIVVNADGSMAGGDYNGLARDVADLVMARVNRQSYGRRGLSAL